MVVDIQKVVEEGGCTAAALGYQQLGRHTAWPTMRKLWAGKTSSKVVRYAYVMLILELVVRTPWCLASTSAGPWSSIRRPASFMASAARTAQSLAGREEPAGGKDKGQ
jgi:hypothetical protein